MVALPQAATMLEAVHTSCKVKAGIPVVSYADWPGVQEFIMFT
jgi:hypothetical protein